MPRRHGRWLIVAGAVLTLVAPAYANAGTAMLWLIPGHLLIGNAIVGLCEWAVLVALLGKPRNPKGKSVAVMVVGNYLSAWGGVLLLPTVWREFITRQYPEPLYQMWPVIATSWLALFVFSILVEWFFIGWAMNQMASKRWGWLRSLRASVIVNVASYAALTGLLRVVCRPASSTSGMTAISGRCVRMAASERSFRVRVGPARNGLCSTSHSMTRPHCLMSTSMGIASHWCVAWDARQSSLMLRRRTMARPVGRSLTMYGWNGK